MFFDSHCHLTDQAFAEDRADVVARALLAGVDGMTTICSDADDLEPILALTRAHPQVWGTAGIHPHEARHGTPAAFDRIRTALVGEPRIRAIGECGLDYHYDHSPRETQIEVFRAQLDLAVELDRPVIVHSRKADADTAHLIREYRGRATGVLHCFSSGAELLDVGLDAGWYVSFAGMVSFKSFDARGLLRSVPSDQLLVETDSPYLAPVPHRGRPNEPAFVAVVGAALAAARGESEAEVAAATRATTTAIFSA